jgi:hypothetical protein
MSVLRPYVHSDTSDHMSGLETVCSLRGFQGEPYFFPLSYSLNQLLRLSKALSLELEWMFLKFHFNKIILGYLAL